MPKPHASLSPTINTILIFVWAAIVAFFLLVVEPRPPVVLMVVGAILGGVGGIMQHLSLKQATESISAASSLLEVRSELYATTWGRRYIWFLYFCKFVLIALAFLVVRQPLLSVIFGYLAAYVSLMFVREVVTLRATFLLYRSSTVAPNVA